MMCFENADKNILKTALEDASNTLGHTLALPGKGHHIGYSKSSTHRLLYL